jgi:hypothetical protein
VSSRLARCAGALLLLCTALPAAAASGRLGGGGGDVSVSIWRILAALVICAAVAFAAVLVIRRQGLGGARRLLASVPRRVRQIEVVETRRLSPHADISLVRQDGQEYLLLLFAGGSRVLRAGPRDLPADEGA